MDRLASSMRIPLFDPRRVSRLKHRPDYTKTLFAPENDDIYREFCEFVDLPEPRRFDAIKDSISIEGYTADDVCKAMLLGNKRLVFVDAGAVYGMLARLRTSPEIAKKVLDFKPTCYQCGTGGGE
ncbi:MAG: hypothetical protein ACOX69_08520 [Coriobacteriales bacterium]